MMDLSLSWDRKSCRFGLRCWRRGGAFTHEDTVERRTICHALVQFWETQLEEIADDARKLNEVRAAEMNEKVEGSGAGEEEVLSVE